MSNFIYLNEKEEKSNIIKVFDDIKCYKFRQYLLANEEHNYIN